MYSPWRRQLGHAHVVQGKHYWFPRPRNHSLSQFGSLTSPPIRTNDPRTTSWVTEASNDQSAFNTIISHWEAQVIQCPFCLGIFIATLTNVIWLVTKLHFVVNCMCPFLQFTSFLWIQRRMLGLERRLSSPIAFFLETTSTRLNVYGCFLVCVFNLT